MTRFAGQFAILFETQPTEGVLAPGLAALVGTPPASVDASDGAVLGDTDSGVGESGISFTAARNFSDKGSVSGSFTRLFDDLLSIDSDTFAFALPLAGNRTSPNAGVDADFELDPGIVALFGCTGLSGAAWGGGLGWEYKPANTGFCSALILDSGTVYAIIDMQGNLAMEFTPGETAICTANFTAKVDKDNSGGVFPFPTVDYGEQQSVSAPSTQEVGNAFGATRGFASLAVGVDNQIEEVPDSNAVNGARIEQSGREVNVTMTLDSDDLNITYDWENLVTEVAPTDDMTFQVGTVNADDGTDPAEAFLVQANNINLNSYTPDRPARAKANQLEGFCTATVDGGEFSLIFN